MFLTRFSLAEVLILAVGAIMCQSSCRMNRVQGRAGTGFTSAHNVSCRVREMVQARPHLSFPVECAFVLCDSASLRLLSDSAWNSIINQHDEVCDHNVMLLRKFTFIRSVFEDDLITTMSTTHRMTLCSRHQCAQVPAARGRCTRPTRLP